MRFRVLINETILDFELRDPVSSVARRRASIALKPLTLVKEIEKVAPSISARYQSDVNRNSLAKQ